MIVEDFRQAFRKEIAEVTERFERRYSVTDEEIAGALYSFAKKYLSDVLDKGGRGSKPAGDVRNSVREFFASINGEDLCLALACAKGDASAWEDFFSEYRGYLVSIARTMTQDPATAEQLADSTFAELYGLREVDGARVSKFSFYSGRGSLRGWLRAVVFQLSADLHRQSSRFVQPEEAEDMDRFATAAAEPVERRLNGELSFVRERYRIAVTDALGKAIAGLDPNERLLFSYYYHDERTLREIGRLFNVHEATVSRWLTKAQKRTRKLVEKSLVRDHGFNRNEMTEAIEMVAEHLDVNVRQYLYDPQTVELEQDRAAKSPEGAVAPH